MKPLTTKEILDFLEKDKIEFVPTQARLCVPIINRLYKKMSRGIIFEGIKITEKVIIDGHHRYVASLLANIELDNTLSSRASSTVITTWDKVELDESDWDTPTKIDMLNKRDAFFNKLEISEIEAMIK